jgi:RIP metalloprotease RseP
VVFAVFPEPTYTSAFPSIGVQPASPGTTTPALAAGLQEGDRIVSINGEPINTWDDVGRVVRPRPDQQVPIVVNRAGQDITLLATLGRRPDCTDAGFLGIYPSTVSGSIDRNPLEGIQAGFTFFGSAVGQTVTGIGRVFGPSGVGRIFKTVTGQTCDDVTNRPTSIIGVSDIGGQAVRNGAQATIMMISIVNLALGLLNLVPVIPLDGGHLLMATIETVKRRKNRAYVIDYAKALPYFGVAIAVMAFVMVSAIWLDVLRIF